MLRMNKELAAAADVDIDVPPARTDASRWTGTTPGSIIPPISRVNRK